MVVEEEVGGRRMMIGISGRRKRERKVKGGGDEFCRSWVLEIEYW